MEDRHLISTHRNIVRVERERWLACSARLSFDEKPRYSTLCGSMRTLVQFRSADESLSRDLLEDDTSWDVQKEKAWYSWLYCCAVTRSRAAVASTAVQTHEEAL